MILSFDLNSHMECNKDEAVRAKQMAESRMQRGEFVDALRFAKKAQNLYAEVENIAQMITVCEVHNAAQNKLFGSDMNWYGILQTERLADESAIKKQYRKLALLLHPDKNKFAGAEAAFKLIGEANRVLSDKAMRSLFDMKFKAFVRTVAPKTSSHHSNGNVFAAKNVGNATKHQNKSSSNTPVWNAHQQAEQKVLLKSCKSCKHCNDKSRYFTNIPNLTCRNCSKPLTPDVFVKVKDPPIPPSKSKGGKPPGADTFVRSYTSFMKTCPTGVGKSKDGYVPASKTTESHTSADIGSKRVRQSTPVSRGSSKAGNSDEKKDANVRENDVDPSRFNVGSKRVRQATLYGYFCKKVIS